MNARALAAVCTATLLGVASVVLVASPAAAADYPVTDEASLTTALTTAGDGDTVTFAASTAITLTASLPPITADISIIGNGSSIDGAAQAYDVFAVSNAAVSITGLSITDAATAINVVDSSFTLSDAFIEGSNNDGLRVLNNATGLTVQVFDAVFQNNNGNGASIYIDAAGAVSVVNASFLDNQNQGLQVSLFGGIPTTLTSLAASGNIGDGFGLYPSSGASIVASGISATENGSDGIETSVTGASFSLADSQSFTNDDNGIDAYVEEGSLTVARSVIDSNVNQNLYLFADDSAVVVEDSSLSGSVELAGIEATLEDAALTVLRSTLASNSANGLTSTLAGASLLLVETSTVSGSGDYGIDVHASDESEVIVARSSIVDNFANGTEVELYDAATLVIDSSTYANNLQGGAWLYPWGDETTVDVVNSTFSNTLEAAGSWPLWFQGEGEFSLRNSTITNNDGIALGVEGAITGTVTHTIIAGNRAGSIDVEVYEAVESVVVDWSLLGPVVNDFSGGALTFGAGVTQNVLNPGLEPLAANGGPTLTHKPTASSPAVNAGDTAIAGAPATDQRGDARIQGGRIDIGSVEIPFALPATGSPASAEGPIIALGMLLLGSAALTMHAKRRRHG